MPSILVADCPRCNTRAVTFDVHADQLVEEEHGWVRVYESFAVCRICARSVIFVLRQREYYERGDPNFRRVPSQVAPSANDMFAVQGYISLKDAAAVLPPDHCPKDVAAAFREGAKCLVIGAHNAAGSMFRLAIDLATKSMLPDPALPGGPNRQQRDKLAYRLDYLFDMGKIPVELRELAHSIREDGNDGAHDGTLEDGAAEDLQDFSVALLEQIYTQPERVKAAKRRRDERRQ